MFNQAEKGFQYQPLNPGEIRLIKFSPRSSPSAPLAFTTVHVSLSSKPRYAALSYCWGPLGDICQIQLDGHEFTIQSNLYQALEQLQNSKLVDAYLWNDAICINQGHDKISLDERSEQILLMRQIFQEAARVVVWLGRPVNEINNRLAFQKMTELHKRYLQTAIRARSWSAWWNQEKARTSGDEIADFLLTIKPATDKGIFDVPGSSTYKAWLGITSLWSAPWWRRTWIFQESTVPEQTFYKLWFGTWVSSLPRKVVFLCGDQVTGWAEICAALTTGVGVVVTPGIDSTFIAQAKVSVDKLENFRLQRMTNARQSFLETLQMIRHTDCLDPRDKVYAVLGLASEDVRRHITPNYADKTVLDVYTEVVRYCLECTDHPLDFLGCAHYEDKTYEVETPQGVKSILPSWVPNFAANLDIHPIPKVVHVPEVSNPRSLMPFDKSVLPHNAEALVAAYKPLSATNWKSYIQNDMLGVRGVCIDTLKDIVQNTGPDLDLVRAKARESGMRWARESNSKYFTGETYQDAMNRLVLLDLVYDEYNRPSERGGKFDLAFVRRPRAELTLTEYRYQMNMRTAQSRASALRNLGRSEKNFLLMMPNTAREGDMIWALDGGQVLYILRPVASEVDRYTYIGECYAHGLMDGDVQRRIHIGEIKMENIFLV